MLEHGREGETNYFENNYSFGTILDPVPAKTSTYDDVKFISIRHLQQEIVSLRDA